MTYTPSERQPTGIPAAPLVLVSGPAKAGKSATSYRIASSDRIHKCWVIDVGEGSADEYAEIGPYIVLNWGTSWSDLTDTIKWCVTQPAPAGKLNAVIIDSGSDIWDQLKDRATQRARGSAKNRKALDADPDAEIDVSMNYWNDAAATWTKIVNPLRLAGNVVGIVIVRADEVAEMANGAPTRNKVISLQAHKSLPAVVTAHVQVRPDHSAWLVEVRSMKVSVPPKGQRLGVNPLHEVLELLAPSGGFAAPSVTVPQDDERYDLDHAASVAVFETIKGLNTADKADFSTWAASFEHPPVTVPAMTVNAEWRARVSAAVTAIQAGFTADDPNDPTEATQTELLPA